MGNPFRNDQWTLVDTLGYEPIVTNMIDVIDNAKPPFTIGIYGGWGTGKTSLMRQLYFRIGGEISSIHLPYADKVEEELYDNLTSNKIKEWKILAKNLPFISVWFNPWQHQFDEEPVIGLLHEIRENFNLFTKASEKAKKLAKVSVRTGLDILTGLIDEFTLIKVDPEKVEKYSDKYKKEKFEIKSSSQRFRLLFEKAIEKLVGKNKKLIIFIDDLDRCNDLQVIKLLEGIKLYLSTSNCIFVFGMDQRNVIRALQKQKIHREYLDKLFQSIIRIPMSKQYLFFISLMVKEYFELENIDKLILLLSDILEKNPRKVKNFLNSLRVYWEMNEDKSKLKVEVLVLFHYLRIYHEPVFTILEREPQYIKNLKEICAQNPPNSKVEHLFMYYLRNPFKDSLPRGGKNEDEVLIPSTIEKEEIEYMEEISSRFESLEKFKEYFVNYYNDEMSNYESETIEKYLGVVSEKQ